MLLPQELPIYTYPAETNNIPLQFSGVFPGEQIGLGSAPGLLAAARATMLRSGFTPTLQSEAERRTCESMS